MLCSAIFLPQYVPNVFAITEDYRISAILLLSVYLSTDELS